MNKIDLLFICDVTGSMGGFIDDAKKRMKSILEQLSEEFGVDTKVGLSLYRDHPGQDTSFVTVVFDLMSIKDIQDKINKITVEGGGDFPEAVLDGIIEGIKSMSWRKGSKKIAFLIGDAPPHGMEGKDCCDCGKTWGEAIQIAEEYNVPIYSIPLDNEPEVISSFKTLSTFSGGLMIQADNALDAVLKTLREELGDMNLGAKILDMLSKDASPEKICKMLNIDREKLSELETKSAVIMT
jgi:hypothetical protein